MKKSVLTQPLLEQLPPAYLTSLGIDTQALPLQGLSGLPEEPHVHGRSLCKGVLPAHNTPSSAPPYHLGLEHIITLVPQNPGFLPGPQNPPWLDL